MQSNLDWDLLKTFLLVAQKGSLSQAAAQMGINHSTVSRRLKQLERELECRLIERSLSGAELTTQGAFLFEAVAEMNDRLQRGLDAVSGPGQDMQAHLRVSTEDTLGYQVLPAVLSRFSRDYPHVQLDLSISSRWTNMSRREADVLITARQEPPQNLVGHKLGDIRIVMMASQAYCKERGKPKSIADFESHRFLAPDAALEHLEMTRWINKHIPDSCVEQRSDKLLYLCQLVKQGLGIAALPHYLLDDELVELFELPRNCWSAAWVLTHPDSQDNAAVRALLRYIPEHLSL